jgi:hypothetical protein
MEYYTKINRNGQAELLKMEGGREIVVARGSYLARDELSRLTRYATIGWGLECAQGEEAAKYWGQVIELSRVEKAIVLDASDMKRCRLEAEAMIERLQEVIRGIDAEMVG